MNSPHLESDGPELKVDDALRASMVFGQKLRVIKNSVRPQAGWYPYDSMANLQHINQLLSGESRNLGQLIRDLPIADIGAADGDTAFFLSELGFSVDIIDNAPTNYNGMDGMRLLAQQLESSAQIHEIDLDSYFSLPRDSYGLVLFLGLLYHLQNPYYVLRSLAKSANYCLLSTRIARFAADRRSEIAQLPVAYLLDPFESNNDPTNYWIFSETGLRRLLDRCGWDVVDFCTLGDTLNSDPHSAEHDERAFALIRSRSRSSQRMDEKAVRAVGNRFGVAVEEQPALVEAGVQSSREITDRDEFVAELSELVAERDWWQGQFHRLRQRRSVRFALSVANVWSRLTTRGRRGPEGGST